MMKNGKKKLNKKRALRRKKMFFIILTAYITIFVITIGITLSWFSGSTWADKGIYMGGPVYMNFQDNDNNNTSGEGVLVMNLPDNWLELYPSMNINIEASALLIGTRWEHVDPIENVVVVSTSAILRAKIIVESRSPEGVVTPMSADITEPIMDDLQEYAMGGAIKGNDGIWLFDTTIDGESYFYYVSKDATPATLSSSLMQSAGNEAEDAVVTFLDHAVVTVPWVLDNSYAGYTLSITVVFQALQAFIPYNSTDIGVTKHHAEDRFVTEDDVGMDRPITVNIAKPVFDTAFAPLYDDDNLEDNL